MRTALIWGWAAALGGVLLYRKMRRSDKARAWEQHRSESEEHYRNAGMRILILGGGFGGLATALQLDQQLSLAEDVSVLVVDRNNDLLFAPLLWTVANGRANPNNVVVPIRNFRKRPTFPCSDAEIERIDLERMLVQTSADERPYDILIIAMGSHTVVRSVCGLPQ